LHLTAMLHRKLGTNNYPEHLLGLAKNA